MPYERLAVCRADINQLSVARPMPLSSLCLRLRVPLMLRALKAGKQVADAKVEHSLYHRANGDLHYAVKIITVSIGDGCSEVVKVPYVEHYPPDTTACIFWLNNRRPDRWDANDRELNS